MIGRDMHALDVVCEVLLVAISVWILDIAQNSRRIVELRVRAWRTEIGWSRGTRAGA